MIDDIIAGTNDSFILYPKIHDGATPEEALAHWIANDMPCDIVKNRDGFQQVGTAKNTDSLISGSTADIYHLPRETATVNLALAKLASGIDRCVVEVDVGYEGWRVYGLETADGGAVYTEADGIARGLSFSSSTTINTDTFVDTASVSKTIDTPLGSKVETTLTLPNAYGSTKTFSSSSSSTFKYSNRVRISILLIGAGGDGQNVYTNQWMARGGNGGFIKEEILPVGFVDITDIVIGSSGWTTSTLVANGVLKSPGNPSGYGAYKYELNPAKADGTNGGHSTKFGVSYGGGGSAAVYDSYYSGKGNPGSPHGSDSVSADGGVPGGGGAAQIRGSGNNLVFNVSKGGAGRIYIKAEVI